MGLVSGNFSVNHEFARKNARKRKALGTRRREHDVLVATKPLFSHGVESAFETKRDSFNARTLTMMRKGKTS